MNYIFSTICSSIFVVKCLSKKKNRKNWSYLGSHHLERRRPSRAAPSYNVLMLHSVSPDLIIHHDCNKYYGSLALIITNCVVQVAGLKYKL